VRIDGTASIRSAPGSEPTAVALAEVNYRVIESTTKGNAARTVDLDRRTVQLLVDHKANQRGECLQWGDAYEHCDLVAAWENGSAIHPQTFSRMFLRRAQEAGLRRIRLHDLRHTHATLALQAARPKPGPRRWA
jgi:integrase